MANYSYTFPIGSGNAIITSGFGNRTAPKAGASTYHEGIDISVPVGTPVLSAFDGTVTGKGTNSKSGNYIIVKSSNGIESIYRHLSNFNISGGANVAAGQQIAQSGNTGITTGPHLHFEIRKDGKTIDPQSFTGTAGKLTTGTMAEITEASNGALDFIKGKWWLLAGALVIIVILK